MSGRVHTVNAAAENRYGGTLGIERTAMRRTVYTGCQTTGYGETQMRQGSGDLVSGLQTIVSAFTTADYGDLVTGHHPPVAADEQYDRGHRDLFQQLGITRIINRDDLAPRCVGSRDRRLSRCPIHFAVQFSRERVEGTRHGIDRLSGRAGTVESAGKSSQFSRAIRRRGMKSQYAAAFADVQSFVHRRLW